MATKNELIEGNSISEWGRLEAERKLAILRKAVIDSVLDLSVRELKEYGVINRLEEALGETMPEAPR